MNALNAIASIQARGGTATLPARFPLAKRIVATAMLAHGVRRGDLGRPGRHQPPGHVTCRRAIASALRTLGLSYPEIAIVVGYRHHAPWICHAREATPADHLRAFEAICDAMGDAA